MSTRPNLRALGYRSVLALAILLSVLASPAIATIDIEASGNHPFPPYIIRLTSMVIAVDSPTWAGEVGDLISGNADGVDQGQHGNCWFESSVGAVARSRRGQMLIAGMITRRGPASYFVNFPDVPAHSVPISKWKIHRDGLRDQAMWSDVLEGAIMNRFPEMQRQNNVSNLRAMYGVDNNAAVGLRIMTGGTPSSLKTAMTSDAAMGKILAENMRLQIPTILSSYPQPRQYQPNHIVVVPNHCFAVLGFSRETNMVTLRNPWGSNNEPRYPLIPKPGHTRDQIHDIGGGVIQLPLPEVRKYYGLLCWSAIPRL